MKVKSAVELKDDFEIDRFLWATSTRLVISTWESEGFLKKGSYSKQRIYGVDVDGSNRRQLYPEACAMNRECVELTATMSRFLSNDIFDDRYVMVAEQKYGMANSRTILRKIDIYSGRSEVVDGSYVEFGDYDIDNEGQARVKISLDKKNMASIFFRSPKSNRWSKMPRGGKADGTDRFDSLGFSKDNRKLYYILPNAKGYYALWEASFDEQGLFERAREIFYSNRSDLHDVKFDNEEKVPLYVDFGWGRPQRKYLTVNETTKALMELEKTFPGENVELVDRMGGEMLLAIHSDERPKSFYIYDSKSQAVRKLLSTQQNVNVGKVVPSRHVVIQARDGVELNAYLYVPRGKGPFPLVVNIHGGPFGVGENWGYSGENQFLVNQGLAVLRVNFRGSGNQGLYFESLGYRNLGTTMQMDIADSIRWAISNGYARSGQVCTYGGSYGGFSAVMSAMLFPDLVKCAVGWGGVYDWESLVSESDIRASERSRHYMESRLPKTAEERIRQSPVSRVDDLKASLFVIHGVADERVPVAQARRLKAALEKAGKSFQYLEYPEVGHWFRDEELKADYYARVSEFLKAHLSAGTGAMTASR